MPGGESTTMTLGVEREGSPSRCARSSRGHAGVRARARADHARPRPPRRARRRAERNAFGRQVRSFETDLSVDGADVHAVFIRAPWIAEAGDDVEVLASVDGHPVAVRQGNLLAVSFHPELAGDTALHERFLEAVRARAA
jgi:5'-phosphate synthase pdxT subunit